MKSIFTVLVLLGTGVAHADTICEPACGWDWNKTWPSSNSQTVSYDCGNIEGRHIAVFPGPSMLENGSDLSLKFYSQDNSATYHHTPDGRYIWSSLGYIYNAKTLKPLKKCLKV